MFFYRPVVVLYWALKPAHRHRQQICSVKPELPRAIQTAREAGCGTATIRCSRHHRRAHGSLNAVKLTYNSVRLEWGEADKVYFYLGANPVNLQHCLRVV